MISIKVIGAAESCLNRTCASDPGDFRGETGDVILLAVEGLLGHEQGEGGWGRGSEMPCYLDIENNGHKIGKLPRASQEDSCFHRKEKK